MSNEQFENAKSLIAAGESVRRAALRVGVSQTTLRRALNRDATPAPEPEPVSKPESLSDSLLPPGIADAIGQASDRAKREAEIARHHEHFDFLANLAKQREQ